MSLYYQLKIITEASKSKLIELVLKQKSIVFM